MTGYIYDADGNRVAKGTISVWSCDPTQNGFQITQNYVLGPSGEELTMLDGNNHWQLTNVYAGGKLVGAYDAAGLHLQIEDPLGTRRMQLSGGPCAVGQPETDVQSLPYGDQLFSFPDQYAPPCADDATPSTSPAKNGTQNPATTTSKLAITAARWAGLCLLTGQRRKSQFPTPIWKTHKA